MGDSKVSSHGAGIFDVARTAAATAGTRHAAARVVKAHRHRHDAMAGLDQQASRNGTIHAAGKRRYH